jgi:hypothetical protein
VVSAAYERDLGATLKISYLNFWTTPSDPWTMNDAQVQAAQFASWWGVNRDTVTRDVAQLLCGHLGGGFGYYYLCNHFSAYAAYGMSGSSGFRRLHLGPRDRPQLRSLHTRTASGRRTLLPARRAARFLCRAQHLDRRGGLLLGADGITPPGGGTIMS